ncbi:MAG: hypothetical protein KKD28_05640 [Chloroflexi bacterium]|nr:hypothetical protein [Chloroflexota bacterium]
MEEDKITIIEGPPPTFEMIPELWVHGLAEGSTQAEMVVTRLRTLNGPALIERCHHAWRNKQTISLEYRTRDGLHTEAPIVAARHVEMDEGDVLLLWLRLTDEAVELEMGYNSDTDDEDDLDLDVMF